MATRNRTDARQNEQRVLCALRDHPTGHISYDRIAALIEIDRRTVISIVYHLQGRGRVNVVQGRGRRPNAYRVIPEQA